MYAPHTKAARAYAKSAQASFDFRRLTPPDTRRHAQSRKRPRQQCRLGPPRMDGGLSLHFGATEPDGKVVFAGFLGFAFGAESASTSG